MSLRRAMWDFALLSLFLGLILTFVLTLYFYVVYREMIYVVLALSLGFAGSLLGIARFLFLVDFWGTIIRYWKKPGKTCSQCPLVQVFDHAAL